ncbi:YfhO family protein [Lentilactobacillus sp. SPB1-3]|uniref:YfhO family protein n=1 Tax=Lentilactobacillus terminaliae TaxID=3003483 RepID=A0ACD5DGV0_9LACO|nr:YfhO family protein [Lentilactobacillus sp. SPB1-3]MCZ0977112.1 YfhO family protein [Lentilactobacillus sp. SPB1-3]
MKSKKLVYFLSFLIPLLIVSGYFIFRSFAPFGSSSVLTVDLGQQYVDFFAFYKHAMLNDPSSILYSFQKALGGNMLGTWSYYLMSPLNLIFLLFPMKLLPAAIGIVTILKYSLSGLTFSIFLVHRFKEKSLSVITFSVSYALMGWMVANQLNLLWLDAVILLPLIFLGLEKLMHKKWSPLFIISMAAMLMINYYMAYMIAIFTTLYLLLFTIPLVKSFTEYLKHMMRYIGNFLIAVLLSAWITVPTFIALQNSKVAYSSNELKFKFEYNPLLMIGKFINGSFDFKQMPNGTPNLFVASLVIFAFIYFFVSPRTSKIDKILSLGLTAFFILSMCFNPLDIFWHAFQLPVWYSYRFAYIFSFWMIVIAYKAYLSIVHEGLNRRALIISSGIIALGLLYILVNLSKFEYLSTDAFTFGVIYVVATIALISIQDIIPTVRILQLGLLILVSGEMSLNLVNSLNNISYLSSSDYTKFAQMTEQSTDILKQRDHNFYRVGKTFQRSKNDALTAGYNGGSNFSSTLENNVSKFYGDMGNPNGDAFVVYTNPTLFTDSLLGFKYLITENPFATKSSNTIFNTLTNLNTNRPELSAYNLIDRNAYLDTYQNQNALPLVFRSNLKNTHPKYQNDDPITYQNELANSFGMTGNLLTEISPYDFTAENATPVNSLNNAIINKKLLLKKAYIGAKIKIKAHSSLYMTINEQTPVRDISITTNGVKIKQFTPFKHSVIVNIGNSSNHTKIFDMNISTTKQNIWLSSIKFYQLNQQKLANWAAKIKQDSVKINQTNSTHIVANFKHQDNKTIVTSIPYDSGWHAEIKNKTVPIHKWANTFIYVNNPGGAKTVKFSYRPQGLLLGIVISCITLIITLTSTAIVRRRK